MKKDIRFHIAPGALLLILVAMLILLAVHKRLATADEVDKAASKAEYQLRDSHASVAIVAVAALFAYVAWTVLRANRGEAEAMPPAKESSANDKEDEPALPGV
jgi:hypothetical protein